jgi:CspA family cold shock protein
MEGRRTGWVKFFSDKKGYGFVTDVQSNEDAFVHFSSLQRRTPGFRSLTKGEYVTFTPQVSDGRISALDVTGVQGGPLMCEVNTVDNVDFS